MDWAELLQAAILLLLGAGISLGGAALTRHGQRRDALEQRDRDDRRHRWEIGRQHAVAASELAATMRNGWYVEPLGMGTDGQLGPAKSVLLSESQTIRDHVQRVPDELFRQRAGNAVRQLSWPSADGLPEDLVDVPAMMQLAALGYVVDLCGAFIREEMPNEDSPAVRLSSAMDEREKRAALLRRAGLPTPPAA